MLKVRNRKLGQGSWHYARCASKESAAVEDETLGERTWREKGREKWKGRNINMLPDACSLSTVS